MITQRGLAQQLIKVKGLYLGLCIKGLVTDGNTKLCCRGFILALFQSTTGSTVAQW